MLVNSIKIHPTLTYFACAGRKDNYLSKDILPLFKLLVDNNRVIYFLVLFYFIFIHFIKKLLQLLELDVSHNHFGDDGARELFDTLRTNYCLKTLSFDFNNIFLFYFFFLLCIYIFLTTSRYYILWMASSSQMYLG